MEGPYIRLRCFEEERNEKTGLQLSPIICNGMILQRDTDNFIYGTDGLADKVTVYFMEMEFSAKVDDNSDFSIKLSPVVAGGPYSMTIKGSSEIKVTDILFGDVYLLSGQSNMELPIRRVLDVSAEEVTLSCEPEIRQYLIPASYNFKEPEKYMAEGTWKRAVDKELMDFSAAGFFFAKEIKKKIQVPIGLILTAVGGSRIESWMSPTSLKKYGEYAKSIEDFKDIDYFHKYIQDQQNAAGEWSLQLEEEEKKFDCTEDYTSWDSCRIPSLASDYPMGSFCGSIYLCREVVLEEEPIGEDAYIYLGSIIDSDKVYINGELVGRTEYRYPPRKYLIKKGILKKGKNLITIRMVINGTNGGTISGKPYHLYCDDRKIDLEGNWYYRVGKIAETEIPEVLFPPKLPIGFYNTVIVPLSKLKMKGVLWYQGESNTGDPENYAEKFATMVADWRELFGWEIPVIYVQLPNYREPLNLTEDSGWAALREQQRRNLSLYNVAMVVTLDIGEWNDLHLQNKNEVGLRLANAARYLVYNENITYSGPIPKCFHIEEKKVVIKFIHLEDSEIHYSLSNFELAGTDGVFHNAVAIRKGKSVEVSSEEIDIPVTVRYAWCDNPININFFNNTGLPATCFRLEL